MHATARQFRAFRRISQLGTTTISTRSNGNLSHNDALDDEFSPPSSFGLPAIRRDELNDDSWLPHLKKRCDNGRRRQSFVDMNAISKLVDQIRSDPSATSALLQQLRRRIASIPNSTHPLVAARPSDSGPLFVEEFLQRPNIVRHKPLTLEQIGEKLHALRAARLSHFCASSSYFLIGVLADVEQALVAFATERLLSAHFQLVSVPELVNPNVLEGCGMVVLGDHSQVLKTAVGEETELALSGTAEMGIGAYLAGRRFREDELPLRFAAVSRCFRAEDAQGRERGLFRVPDFTKVEMFAVTAAETSNTEQSPSDIVLDEIVGVQKSICIDLDLHAKLYDMPAHELGLPAHRKFDIEAWMPGRGVYGEISSASNCTDFQARRLGITYVDESGRERFAHTVNGTACAVPRTLIALVEQHQSVDYGFRVPAKLQPYLGGSDEFAISPYKLEVKTRKPSRSDTLLE